MTYDIAVIGCGIVGAACAFRLAQRGLRVLVLEAQAAAAMGSTAKSAAGIRVQFSDATNILLSWHSLQEYQSMPEAAYFPQGYLFLVPRQHWAAQQEALALQQSLGMPVQALSPQEAQRYVPFSPLGLAGATYGWADGVLDPHGITMAYVAKARALGAHLVFMAQVQGLVQGQFWQINTSQGVFRSHAILNAAGAWAGQVGQLAGLDIPVMPARRMVFASAPLAHPHRYPLTIDLESGFWLRSEGERVIFGQSNPADVGFAEGMDWEWLQTCLPNALQRFPWFESLGLDHKASWWGYYEVTPDHNPILGRMPGVTSWFNAAGFSGHGVQQAAMTARLIAEEVVDGQAHSQNIDSHRYQRFAQARLLHERHIV